ncbi:Quinone oxidoreductase-like protein 2 [Cladobotryum mycophilum]|uniref:Quinone oxidoreductase-like protein 2 n=1 Tax=Cladobotryum mycophilum TaxID=491253 RepID=A0ABR0SLI0_9HYPO
MKAVLIKQFYENLGQVHVSEIPTPTPQANHVVVKVVAAGVNFVDTLYARGKHQNNRSLVRPPFILGLEFAGIVISAPQTSQFKIGDAIFGDHHGSYNEFLTVPADSPSLQKVPSGWSLTDAAGLGATLPVSYGALALAGKLRPGETVLVHAAAGGLGIMAVQIAVAMGCRVLGTAGSDEKCTYAQSYGASKCVNYTKDDWWKRILEETDGKGVDVVYDPVGQVDLSLKCVAHRGRILIVGFAAREGQMEKIAMNRLLLKQVTLLGYRYGESIRRYPEERDQIWSQLTSLIQSGKIRPTVFKVYHGLENVPEALADISSRKVLGKAVVQVSPETKKEVESKL